MNTYWTLELAPVELIKLFLRVGRVRPFGNAIKDGWAIPPKGMCTLMWESDPSLEFHAPRVISTDHETLFNILPKLMAIPGSLSPVTSFCRLWLVDDTDAFMCSKRLQMNTSKYAGFVGLIIGELFVKNGSAMDLKKLGLATSSRAYAHACARLALRGASTDEIDSLQDAWVLATQLTHNSVDHSLINTVNGLCKFIAVRTTASDETDGSTLSLANSINEFIQLSTSASQLSLGSISVQELPALVKALTREDRLSYVEKMVQAILSHASLENTLARSLICGFLVSLIDPGTLDFFDLAYEMDNRQGDIACAYAMCAGLLGGSSFLWKSDGYGVSLVSNSFRLTTQGFSTTPDLSLSELHILKDRIHETGFDFRTKNPSTVEVELLPDITGSFGNGAKRDANRQTQDQLRAKSSDEIDKAIAVASDLATSLQNVLLSLRQTKPSSSAAQPKRRQKKLV
jgi:hypothetical protein